MNVPLLLASALAVLLAAAHSYLGERFILIRLFRRDDLPKLFGGAEFTRHTLRFAWHITSVLAVGFAALLAMAATGGHELNRSQTVIISATFAVSGVVALAGSRGRHLSWIAFFAIAGLVWFGGN